MELVPINEVEQEEQQLINLNTQFALTVRRAVFVIGLYWNLSKRSLELRSVVDGLLITKEADSYIKEQNLGFSEHFYFYILTEIVEEPQAVFEVVQSSSNEKDPYSLVKLNLRYTDYVKEIEFSELYEAMSCNNCKKKALPGTSFLRCSRCRRAYFCSKECQIIAWVYFHRKLCTAHVVRDLQRFRRYYPHNNPPPPPPPPPSNLDFDSLLDATYDYDRL